MSTIDSPSRGVKTLSLATPNSIDSSARAVDLLHWRAAGPPAPKGLAAPARLPCQNGDKSITITRVGEEKEGPRLTATAAKSVFCLAKEIEKMGEDFPIDNIGFLTLTFKDNVTSRAEAGRRFRSLRTNVIRKRFVRSISVSERQERGAWHFHLIVVTKGRLGDDRDCRLAKNRRYREVSQSLRQEWAFWRGIEKRYKFGRTEILPVRSTSQAIGKYVGKYVAKGMKNRSREDKGVRRVSYINYKGHRTFKPSFGWNSPGGRRWRRAVHQFALESCCKDESDLARKFGRRWCHRFQGILLGYTERAAKKFPAS